MVWLLNIFFLIIFILSSSFFFFTAALIKLLTFPFDKRLVLLHRFASVWGSFYLWILPNWSVKINGREKIRHDATYMVVSNHQSMVDILLGYRLFFHFKWVAKAELFMVPFIGWNMLLNRYVFVKRGDRKSIKEMMDASEAHLRKGNSVFIFPEGTRSDTGEVQTFKTGAFSLAKRVGVPVLPIAISGSTNALPKGSWLIRGWHKMQVTVLDEIPADVVQEMSSKILAQTVQQQIEASVQEMDKARLLAASK